MESSLRLALIKFGCLFHEKNFLAAADGNLSTRLDDTHILITPSQTPKIFLQPEDIAIIKTDGTIVSGNPSSERLVHLEIYRRCPHARAVFHAHPPVATAWTLAHPYDKALPTEFLPEVTLACGEIPIVPYAKPGGEELAARVGKFLPHARVLLLARHGAVTWGESLQEAFCGMERAEHAAQMLRDAAAFGGAIPLTETELAELKEIRKKIGAKSL